MSSKSDVARLEHDETVYLDPACLVTLYRDLGPIGAESVVCRAMSEINMRLQGLKDPYLAGRWGDVARQARALHAISEQVGMTKLSRVARAVAECAVCQDAPALAACLARLERVGYRSLSAIWDLTGTEA